MRLESSLSTAHAAAHAAAIDLRPWHRRWSRTTFLGIGVLALTLLTWIASFGIGYENALTILSIAGFCGAIIGLRWWPAAGLMGVGMLCTLDAMTRVYLLTGGLLRYNTFNYLLLIACALSIPFLLRLNDLNTRLYELLFLLLVLGLLYTLDRRSGILHLLSGFSYLGLLIYFARTEFDNQAWLWMGIINGLLAGLGGLSFTVFQDSLPYINPNAAVYFWNTAMFSICLVVPFASGRWHVQLVLLTLALVNSMWVFLSASRGGLMVMGFCMLYILVTLRNVKLLLYMLIPLAIIGGVITTQFADQQAYTIHRITKTFDDSYSATGRTSGRSDLALGGWYIFLDNPLGVGTGGFSRAWINLDMREGISGFKRGQRAQAHTAWIKTLAENGIPGIILMAGFVCSFAIVGLRNHNRDLLWLGILTTVCLSAAFLATEFRSKGLWFLAAGSAVLLNRDIMVAHLHGSLRRTPILSIMNPELTRRYE